MNKITATVFCGAVFCGAAAFAGVAYPSLQEITQPDGTSITVRQVGDEFHHFIQTEDGLPLVMGDDGFFCYMGVDGAGLPVSSGIVATSPEGQAYARTADFGKVYDALNSRGSSLRAGIRRNVGPSGKLRTSNFPVTGEIRALVLLVEFADVRFRSATVRDDFDAMLNSPGYDRNGACGSARDWFLENSGGRFSPQFDVVGPVTLIQNVDYYGANAGGRDANCRQLPVDACNAVRSAVDFSKYDEDGDGLIDNVFIFYAGYGEHLGIQYANTIWPHAWEVAGTHNYNGKKLNHYACTSELDINSGMVGSGTFVHEFAHVMGLADHYCTTYNPACFTAGPWDVMDTGEHNNNGHTPPRLNAFERFQLGWLSPTEIGLEPANLSLRALELDNEAFIITTRQNNNEFFLLENRQQDSWDAYLPYHGLLIYHVDFNSAIWLQNKVNDNPDHLYFDLVEGDNTRSDSSRDTDCFPGRLGMNTEFTDESVVAMLTWSGEKVKKPITDIAEKDGVITFKIRGGVAEDAAVDGILDGNGEEVRYYTLQGVRLAEPPRGELVIEVSGSSARKILLP